MKHVMLFLFSLVSVIGFTQPTNNAPNPPTRNLTDVISIYGDTYTPISSVNYNPFWGQSGTVNIAFNPGTGNPIMAYTNFNFQGTGFEANPQNASAMEFIHIDIWTNNATVVKFSPIDNSGTGPGEVLVDVPVKKGEWSSVDIPKSAFTGMTWNNLIQLKFDGQAGVSPSDIYLDNIYFWKKASAAETDATLSALQLDGAPLTGFTPSAFTYSYGVPGGGAVPQITLATPTNPAAKVTSIVQATGIPGTATVSVTAADNVTKSTYSISFFYNSPAVAAPKPTNTQVISLFSNEYTNVTVDNWTTGWSQATYEEVNIAGNPTKKYTNLGFNGVETTSSPINASSMRYFHFHAWTPNITKLNVKLVSFLGDGFAGANGDSEGALDFALVAGQWNKITIPLDSLKKAGLKTLEDINQYIFTSTPFGSGTLFIDNVYFSSDLTNTKKIDRQANALTVFPNPASVNTHIRVVQDLQSIEIYNISGQLVRTGIATEAISLLGMEKGMYIVKGLAKDGKNYIAKLMVK